MTCTLRHSGHVGGTWTKKYHEVLLFVAPTWPPNLCLLNLKGLVASHQLETHLA